MVHHQRLSFDAVDVSNIGVIERSQHLRLTLKAEQAGGTESERFGQHLQRHVALQFHVAGAVDLTLATGTDGRICRRLPLLQSPGTIAEKNSKGPSVP